MRAARRAVDAAKRAISVNPGDSRALQHGALALWHLGQTAESEEWAERAVEVDPNEVTMLYNMACLSVLSGNPERALDLLERAADAGWSRPEWASQDPDLASIRSNPRYIRLLARFEKPKA
jgi:adenylate cyclase